MTPCSRIWITGLTLASFAVLPSATVLAQQYNTYYGSGSGQSGNRNANFGFEAGTALSTASSGVDNATFGYNAATFLSSGSRNTAMGSQAGRSLNAGTDNTTVGQKAGYGLTSGSSNTFLGSEAGLLTTSGTYNVSLGVAAGGKLTTGTNNVLLGVAAGGGFNNTGGISTGTGNIVIGTNSVRNGSNVGDYNVVLGYGAAREYSFPTGKSMFVVNNQAQMSNPILFGRFADNADHYSATSAVPTSSKAQLAINTSFIEPGMTLTINGPTYIGKYAANHVDTAVRDSLLSRYYLWVEKGIVAEDVAIAKVQHWGDYVLEKEYKLRPLSEVEAFIAENKHLPEVPSASHLEKNGYSSQEMDKNFIVKIEELTLYTIKQHKEIEALHAKIAQYERLSSELETLKTQMAVMAAGR